MLQELDLLEQLQAWSGIKSVIMMHAKREFENKIQEEYRFYLSSKKEPPQYFQNRIRAHWSIENQLHLHLDVSFDEEKS